MPAARAPCASPAWTKANILRSFAFFRKVFDEVAAGFPDVVADHLYVDAAAWNWSVAPSGSTCS